MVSEDGTYVHFDYPEGYNILINGQNHYINFGVFSGISGYGFRDNNGVIEFKNETGDWLPIASTAGGGVLVPISGVVDGVNTVFTFDASPTVIVVDQGRTIFNGDGFTTVGNVATLDVAPTFDIKAISSVAETALRTPSITSISQANSVVVTPSVETIAAAPMGGVGSNALWLNDTPGLFVKRIWATPASTGIIHFEFFIDVFGGFWTVTFGDSQNHGGGINENRFGVYVDPAGAFGASDGQSSLIPLDTPTAGAYHTVDIIYGVNPGMFSVSLDGGPYSIDFAMGGGDTNFIDFVRPQDISGTPVGNFYLNDLSASAGTTFADDFSTYTVGTPVSECNGGTGWAGAYSGTGQATNYFTTIYPNSDFNMNIVDVTYPGGTLTLANPTGAAIDGQELELRVTATNGQTPAHGSIYRGSISGFAGTTYATLKYNSEAAKWDIISSISLT